MTLSFPMDKAFDANSGIVSNENHEKEMAAAWAAHQELTRQNLERVASDLSTPDAAE